MCVILIMSQLRTTGSPNPEKSDKRSSQYFGLKKKYIYIFVHESCSISLLSPYPVGLVQGQQQQFSASAVSLFSPLHTTPHGLG